MDNPLQSEFMAEKKFTGHPTYSCNSCRNPVALHDDLISKKFRAKSGQAYMFSHAMNIVVGHKEDKQLMTCVFSVADIFCSNCGELLGWKYVRAYSYCHTPNFNTKTLCLLKADNIIPCGGVGRYSYDARQRFKEGNFIFETAKILKGF
ncbi:protein yippee-like At4g27745 [Cornus florida]|uniref:protein yippee-like At4g27745 n=1 Tax=Cornus florida TaxID=4283 RepID=UPI0028A158FA|nr:protein yippee-like At4g27745 [Cornus florida]